MYSSSHILHCSPTFGLSNSNEYIQFKLVDKMQVDGFQVLASASSLAALILHRGCPSPHALGGNGTDRGCALLSHNLAVKRESCRTSRCVHCSGRRQVKGVWWCYYKQNTLDKNKKTMRFPSKVWDLTKSHWRERIVLKLLGKDSKIVILNNSSSLNSLKIISKAGFTVATVWVSAAFLRKQNRCWRILML